MMKNFLIAVVLLCLSVTAAVAENPPVPERKTPDLEKIQSRLSAEQKNRDSLATQMRQAERDMEDTRKNLKKIAGEIQDGEKIVAALEQRIATLTAEEKDVTARLEKDYAAVGDMILILQRLRRTPPEALIVRPDAPLETAQTALLLKSMLPAVQTRAQALGADLSKLADIRAQLDRDRQDALAGQAALNKKYADIKALNKKREKLFKTLNSDYQATAAAIESLTREAQSVQDLMARLQRQQDDERRQATVAAPGRSESPKQTARRWTLPKAGKPELPVAGTIAIGYGERDKIGARSEGLTIETQPGALAVAPMGGKVRFAGAFKNYGQMVIVEHEGGWHSLIGGLEDISVSAGESLDAGEPLGKLPDASSRGGRPALYYELRHKGQPVDPARKISGLKS